MIVPKNALVRLFLSAFLSAFVAMTGIAQAQNTPNGDRVSDEQSEPPEPNGGNGSRIRAPLEGRVEVLENTERPTLPHQGSAEYDEEMPVEFAGKWYGDVKVLQMQTFPELHAGDEYAQEFIREIGRFVHLNQPGQITLIFKRNQIGLLELSSSDVILKGRVRLELSCMRGPALVRGGYNVPRIAMNRINRLPDQSVEQTRLDKVTIVDELGRPIRRGFTEISASFKLVSERKMVIKLLDIDYDQDGVPLWKVLLKGEARRF